MLKYIFPFVMFSISGLILRRQTLFSQMHVIEDFPSSSADLWPRYKAFTHFHVFRSLL